MIYVLVTATAPDAALCFPRGLSTHTGTLLHLCVFVEKSLCPVRWLQRGEVLGMLLLYSY